MANHRVRVEAYRSRSDARRHFSRLKKAGVDAVSIRHPVEDAAMLLELLEQGRKREITIRALHTRRASFFQSDGLMPAIARLYRPNDPLFLRWMPLESIVLDATLDARSDYDELRSVVHDQARAMRQLVSGYHVALKARLRFAKVDGQMLGDLAGQLIHGGFTEVNLEFTFPRLRRVQVESVKRQLEVFCRHPIARHHALRITHLPFCWLPPQHFRPLYRELRDRVPSQAHLYRQHALVQEIKAAARTFHPPCGGCRRRAACYAITPIEQHPEYQKHLRAGQEQAIVFVGASLTAADKRALESGDLVFTAPAEQGDAFMAILEGFRTILLLDGYFFQRYALTTFELMVALLENVNVFGASSLGALRGLELANYGMRAQGYVYRFLRRHRIAPYHVVAQTYDEHDQPLTEPLIAIHRFLELAEADNIIGASERVACYAVAEGLHYTQLTYREIFAAWKSAGSLPDAASARLMAFHIEQGSAAFNVKRQDALALIESYRVIVDRDGPTYTIQTLEAARDTHLVRLRSKYLDDPDRSLAPNWKHSPDARGTSPAGRERSLAESIALAERFCHDLDVVVADTSLLDKTGYFMINVVFVPFYFLGYGNSAGSGYGETKEQALVSAYGEVLERIPCGTLHTRFVDRDRVRSPKYPFRDLPFYYSMARETLQFFVDSRGRLRDRDYVEGTDLVTGERVAIPKHAARLPSSCGMAAGNTLLEAVLYGLYEVVEHDVYAHWETNALFRALRHVNIDPDIIRDEALKTLLADVTTRGHRVHFFSLLNPYDIPMVLCAFYESDRRLVFSGLACRMDLNDAMAHAFHEALNGHYVSYLGSRDDRRGMEQESPSDPQLFLEQFVAPGKRFAVEAPDPRTLAQEFDIVLSRLQRHGVEHVLAIDLSPRDEYQWFVAKLIMPGLAYRRAARRSHSFYRRCNEIHQLVTRFVADGDPVEEITRRQSVPRREFSLPLQRFFKA
jgi:YcaO-like protein with predicted kinase domain